MSMDDGSLQVADMSTEKKELMASVNDMSNEKKELHTMASEIAKKFAASAKATAAHVNRVIGKLTAAEVLTNDEIRSLSKEYFVDSLLMNNGVCYDIELWRKILMSTRYEGKLH